MWITGMALLRGLQEKRSARVAARGGGLAGRGRGGLLSGSGANCAREGARRRGGPIARVTLGRICRGLPTSHKLNCQQSFSTTDRAVADRQRRSSPAATCAGTASGPLPRVSATWHPPSASWGASGSTARPCSGESLHGARRFCIAHSCIASSRPPAQHANSGIPRPQPASSLLGPAVLLSRRGPLPAARPGALGGLAALRADDALPRLRLLTLSAGRARLARDCRTMATQLIQHERIRTTLPKAKELRRVVDKLVTLGKRGERLAASHLPSHATLCALVRDSAPISLRLAIRSVIRR